MSGRRSSTSEDRPGVKSLSAATVAQLDGQKPGRNRGADQEVQGVFIQGHLAVYRAMSTRAASTRVWAWRRSRSEEAPTSARRRIIL